MAAQQALGTIVGNAAFTPELHLTENSARTSLRVISNRRRFDRTTNQWVDAGGCGIDVTCWGDLARNVAASVHVGDPVIVSGRLEESSWTTSEGQARRKIQLVADFVAHDLTRGRSAFTKVRHEREDEAAAEQAEQVNSDGDMGGGDAGDAEVADDRELVSVGSYGVSGTSGDQDESTPF